MSDEKTETQLVLCPRCDELVHPVTANTVSLIGATVVTVHACPHCEGRQVSVAAPFS